MSSVIVLWSTHNCVALPPDVFSRQAHPYNDPSLGAPSPNELRPTLSGVGNPGYNGYNDTRVASRQSAVGSIDTTKSMIQGTDLPGRYVPGAEPGEVPFPSNKAQLYYPRF